jgi:hypothetical protein
MNAIQIVEGFLKTYGFDGLYCEFCSCKIGDLMPCGSAGAQCEAGYLQECLYPDGSHDWQLGREKDGRCSQCVESEEADKMEADR